MRFVDSHLHLDSPDAGDIVKFAASAGVLLLGCGVDEKSSRALLELAEGAPGNVRPFVGVHPSEAEGGGDLGWLGEASKKAAGMGEIGLDPSYSAVSRGSAQMRVFQAQIEAAEAEGKPVQVHSRKAEAECLELLGASRVPRVLMHWLESEEALPKAMERGYYVSFGPALLYSRRLQRIAARADLSLVLLESDAPVRYAPLGGAGGPGLVPSVAFRLAELLGEPFQDTLVRCTENSLRFLGEKG